MTDINKHIEEALRSKIKNFKNSTTIFDTRDYVLIDDAIGIVSSFIDSSRWRKVEELTDFKDFGTHIITRVPNEKEVYYYTTVYIEDKKRLNALLYAIKIEIGKDANYVKDIEWKPID